MCKNNFSIANIFFLLIVFSTLPVLAQDNSNPSTELKLPGIVSDLDVGGSGDYLLLQFDELRKIAVVDTRLKKIIGYLPSSGDNTRFAAGKNKVVLVDSISGVVSRWNLKTLEKELAKVLEANGLRAVLMGSATESFAVIAAETNLILDIDSLQTTPFETKTRESRSLGPNSRISSNGKTISTWDSGVSPSGLQTYYLVGDQWEARYDHTSVGHLYPSADGRHILTSRGIYTKELRVVSTKRSSSSRPLIPAQMGPFYLDTSTGVLHLIGDTRPMGSMPNPLVQIENAITRTPPTFRSSNDLPEDKRTVFLSQQKLIIKVDSTNDRIQFYSYDVNEELRKSGNDYLIVGAGNPAKVNAGDALSFPLGVITNAKKVNYAIESGPNGMTVSTDGTVQWNTNKNVPNKGTVIVSISTDLDQQAFHAFNFEVLGATGSTTQKTTVSANSLLKTPDIEENTEINEVRQIKMPGTIERIVAGGGGRYLCLHMPQLGKIAVFDVSLGDIIGYVPAADSKTYFAAGKEKLIVFSVTQGVVSRFNLADQERELTKTIPFPGQVDFVGMGSASSDRVLVRYATGPGAIDTCLFGFLDVSSLTNSQLDEKQYLHSVVRDRNRIFASADGGLFSIFGEGIINSDGQRFLPRMNHSRGNMIPSANGKFFVSGSGVYNSQLQLIGKKRQYQSRLIVPAVNGNYYLAFSSTTDIRRFSPSATKAYTAKLHMFGDSRPLISLNDIKYNPSAAARFGNQPITPYDRVFFVPEAKVVAILSASKDVLALHRLDIDEALEASGVDYLLVASNPKEDWKGGETFNYQLNVKSKNGDLKYNLDSAPDGMKVDTDGQITWPIPTDLLVDQHKIIVSVKDAKDQEIFHTFSVNISDVKERMRLEKERIAKLRREEMNKARLESMKKELDIAKAKFLARVEKAKQDAASAALVDPNTLREWTSRSGADTIKGKFSEIVNKSTLKLIEADGKILEIELNDLRSSDAYMAVELDVKKRLGADPNSAFKLSTAKKPISAKLRYELYLEIKRMTEAVEGKAELSNEDLAQCFEVNRLKSIRVKNAPTFLMGLYMHDLTRAYADGPDVVRFDRIKIKKFDVGWRFY